MLTIIVITILVIISTVPGFITMYSRNANSACERYGIVGLSLVFTFLNFNPTDFAVWRIRVGNQIVVTFFSANQNYRHPYQYNLLLVLLLVRDIVPITWILTVCRRVLSPTELRGPCCSHKLRTCILRRNGKALRQTRRFCLWLPRSNNTLFDDCTPLIV